MIRSLLEGLCARWATEHISKEQMEEMDEYVLNLIGYPFMSEKERELSRRLRHQTYYCAKVLNDLCIEKKINAFMECTKVMFCCGMVFEMQQLELKEEDK